MSEHSLVDVCLYYDHFQGGAPQPNGGHGAKLAHLQKMSFFGKKVKTHPDAVWSHTQIQDDLADLDITFRETRLSQPIQAGTSRHHWYVIEPFFITQCFRENQSVLKALSRRALQMLRSGQLSLVIWYPKEAHDLEMDDWFALLNQGVKDLGIKNCILYFSDMNVQENALRWSARHSTPLHLTPRALDYWFDSHRSLMNAYLRDDELGTFLRPEPVLREKPRPKHYLCLNAVAKAHRVFLVNDLGQKGLLPQSHHSLLFRYGHTVDRRDLESEVDKYLQLDDRERATKIREIESFLDQNHPGQPIVLDRALKDYGENDRVHQPWIYQETYCSVVTESVVDDDIFFLTEKTYKCFHFLHPFLLFGSVGALTHLRKMGFETFPDWFDESYDSEPDLRKRYQLVLQNIQSLCQKDLKDLHKLYQNSWEKLEHNWQHFFLAKRKHDFKERVLGTEYNL